MSSTRELCFNREAFAVDTFNADAFIADARARLPLDSVLTDLQQYATQLKRSLLDVVNSHFSSFAELSAALDAVGVLVARLEPTLETLSSDVHSWSSRISAGAADVARIDAALAETRRRKELLGRLRDTLQTLARLEAALSRVPGEDEDATAVSPADLERSAHLSSRLAWLAEDSGLRGAPLIVAVRDRIAAARAALRDSLGQALLAALRSRDSGTAATCLRAFLAMGEPAQPATVFRSRVVRPLVVREVTAESVSASTNFAGMAPALGKLSRWAAEECSFLVAAGRAAGSPEFDFVAGVWAEVDEALAVAAPAALSPAIPDTFHRCFRTVSSFVSSLEALCNAEELGRLRAHPAYAQLSKRWNTKLYFHLRTQEIAGSFEASLALPKRQQVVPSAPFCLKSSKLLWDSMRLCFDADSTFLSPVATQFVRLALQLLARFTRWVSDGASSKVASLAAGPATPVRGGAPVAMTSSDEPWQSMSTSEFLSPHHDVTTILKLMTTDFRQCVSKCIGSCFPEASSEIVSRINEALDDGLLRLQNARLLAESVFIGGATQSCTGALKQMYGIMASVRQSSKKAPGTQASFWVTGVFDPLRVLLEASASLAAPEDRARWASRVTDSVFEKATEICGELMMTVSRTDDVMLKMSSTSEPVPQSSAHSDSDRFLAQLAIDVQELGRLASRFGIDAASSSSFQRLSRCVRSPT